MNRWLISVPVWGERYVETFCATALPALEAAVGQLEGVDARLVVHTDNPKRIRDGATSLRVEARPLPAGAREFDIMSQAHREVLAMGCNGDRVCLLTADLVVSLNGLVYCDRVLGHDRTKRLVACAGVRAILEGPIPVGAPGHILMDWAWDHRHPMTEACVWPGGRSHDLSRIYFQSGATVVTRLCLPHPLVVKIDGRPLRFNPTIDANLINNFSPAEVHLETSSDYLALVELSPIDKGFDASADPMALRYEKGGIILPGGMQGWCVRHRVVLCGGQDDCGDEEIINSLVPESDYD